MFIFIDGRTAAYIASDENSTPNSVVVQKAKKPVAPNSPRKPLQKVPLTGTNRNRRRDR